MAKQMTKAERAKAALKDEARQALEALGMRKDTIARRLKAQGIKVPYPVHTGIGCPMQQLFLRLYGHSVPAVYGAISDLAPKNLLGLHKFIRWNDEQRTTRGRKAA